MGCSGSAVRAVQPDHPFEADHPFEEDVDDYKTSPDSQHPAPPRRGGPDASAAYSAPFAPGESLPPIATDFDCVALHGDSLGDRGATEAETDTLRDAAMDYGGGWLQNVPIMLTGDHAAFTLGYTTPDSGSPRYGSYKAPQQDDLKDFGDLEDVLDDNDCVAQDRNLMKEIDAIIRDMETGLFNSHDGWGPSMDVALPFRLASPVSSAVYKGTRISIGGTDEEDVDALIDDLLA